jgi:hypothetical protein
MSIFTAPELPTFLDIELLWRKRNIKERLFCQEERRAQRTNSGPLSSGPAGV